MSMLDSKCPYCGQQLKSGENIDADEDVLFCTTVGCEFNYATDEETDDEIMNRAVADEYEDIEFDPLDVYYPSDSDEGDEDLP